MKRITVAVLSTLLTSTIAYSQVPTGWKTIAEDKGKCQFAVPSSWKQQEILGKKIAAAESPDKSVDVVINLMDGVDWSLFNQVVWSVYGAEKDQPKIESGANRLWFHILKMAPQGKTGWYVAVPGKAGACNAQVNFKKGSKPAEETARKIVDSIRSN
jgi:hypothetical protein